MKPARKFEPSPRSCHRIVSPFVIIGKVCRSFAFYLATSLLACAQVVWAQTARYEGQPIADIQFVPQEQPLTAAELANAIPLKKGEPLRLADVHAAIERLYATGAFDDIQVDADPAPAPASGVIVRIATKNSWFVGNGAVLGHISHLPNPGHLAPGTRQSVGQPFTEEDVAPAQTAIERLLESNGLHASQVRPAVSYDPHTQQVSVHFVVDSGRRAHFTTPAISGDTKMPLQDIVRATHWRRWLIGGWRTVDQARVSKGVEDVRSRYERRGRFEARVSLKAMDYD